MDSHVEIIDMISGELRAYNTELENVEASLTQAANAQKAMNAASQAAWTPWASCLASRKKCR